MTDTPTLKPCPTKADFTEAFDMTHRLIQEAKPREGYITDHLDAAEGWLDKLEEMLDAYRTRTDAQPTQSDVERVARALAQADGIEICSDATYALSSYGHKAKAALAAMRQAATQERAKIVAWLRKEAIMSTDTVRRRMNKALDQIEAGEHLK